ncbi:MAG: hypothetical protein ABMA64_30990 [Myxococcota bacterium]
MIDEGDWTKGKTKTGNLEFNVAAGACYLPVSFLHLIAAVVFLASEPREHRFVRFHAVQSLLLFAITVGGSLVLLIGGMMVVPLIVMVLGGVVAGVLGAASQDLADLVMGLSGLVAMVSYFVGALGSIAMSFAFPVSFVIALVMVFTGKEGKFPLIGALASRLV